MTQTQNPQIEKVKIDLMDMYKFFSWYGSASDTLKSILNNIDKDASPYEIALLVNMSPDVGTEIVENNTKYSDDEILERLESMDYEDEIEKLAEEIARETGKDVILIELLDGYEWAYAVVVK